MRYICPNCGKVYENLDERFKFCGGCGTPINLNPSNNIEEEDIDTVYSCVMDNVDLELDLCPELDEFDLTGSINDKNISILDGYYIEEDDEYMLYDEEDNYLMTVSLDEEMMEFEIIDAIDELGVFDDEYLYEETEYEDYTENDSDTSTIVVNQNNNNIPKLYQVILNSYDNEYKVALIKLVYNQTKVSLVEAKALVDNAPSPIASFETEEEAQNFAYQIKELNGDAIVVKKDQIINNNFNDEFEDKEYSGNNDDTETIVINKESYSAPKLYQVILNSCDSDHKISLINLVRKQNDISIIEAKRLIDDIPSTVGDFETEEEANSFVKQIKELKSDAKVEKNEFLEEFFNETIENDSINTLLSDVHIAEMIEKYNKMVLDNSDAQINDLYFSKHPHLLTEEQKLIIPIDQFKSNLEKYKKRINETVDEYQSFLDQASLNRQKFLYLKDKKSLKTYRLISFVSALIVLACSGLLFLFLLDGFKNYFNKSWIKYVQEATNYKVLNIILCVICIIGILYGLIRIIGNLISGHNKKVDIILKSKDFENFVENKNKMINGEED